MDESVKSSIPDGTPPSPNANLIMRTDATMAQETVAALPELNFLAYSKIMAPIARDVEVFCGIPMLVPIIQSAHESRNGNSGLAKEHCNLFGMTATDAWKKAGNPVAAMKTWEVIKGEDAHPVREFKKYKTWRDSFFDWARLISSASVYKKAYTLLTNPASVTEGIAEMAKTYATDPKYARKLLELYAQTHQGENL